MNHTPLEVAMDRAQHFARRTGKDYVLYHSDLLGWCEAPMQKGDERVAEFIVVRCPVHMKNRGNA